MCARHGALLVLDEAHAVLGPTPDLSGVPTWSASGTLSKTLGSLGGFAAGPGAVLRLLVNRARSYIFTDRVDARPTPRPRSPRWRSLRSAEGDELRRAASVRTSSASGPAIRRRSSRS